MEITKKFLIILFGIVILCSSCAKKQQTNETKSEQSLLNQSEIVNKAEDAEINEPLPIEIKASTIYCSLQGKLIVIDAGHGINSYNKQEPIAPTSSETKNAFVSGTHGANQTEEELNLAVALKICGELKERGAIVYMTRTEHESNMTNVDRAEFANKLNADISVKIHADGSTSNSIRGVSVLIPGEQYISDVDIINKSRRAGELILEEFVASTGAVNRGISVRNDLTGFNWTEVPIVLVEMGFMTNPEEDRLMGSEEYQDKMVQGILKGLERYFDQE